MILVKSVSAVAVYGGYMFLGVAAADVSPLNAESPVALGLMLGGLGLAYYVGQKTAKIDDKMENMEQNLKDLTERVDRVLTQNGRNGGNDDRPE